MNPVHVINTASNVLSTVVIPLAPEYEYSGTPLNDHRWWMTTLSVADTHLGPANCIAIQNSTFKKALFHGHLSTPYNFCSPNCTQTNYT